MTDAPLVFSTRAYAPLCRDFVRAGGFDAGDIDLKTFPDGERYQRLATPVAGRDAVLMGGTLSDSETLELYDLACAAAMYGARRLTLVIPYFGYSTMERAVKPGEVVTAKTRARLFSAVPSAAEGNRVVLLDLHSEGIPHYFEGGIVPMHVYAKPVIAAAARRLGGADFVLGSTDAGRAKWVESLANDLGVPPAFVFKRRLDARRTEVTAVSAAVAGKTVLIYDDMIRTGSSLVEAARAYRAAGASSTAALTTHAVLPGDALQRIRATGLFTTIVATDSHPRARELEGDFLKVESIAPLLAGMIR